MKLELLYETKPFKLNQEWGRHDPAIYSQFGFTRHNGIDIAPGINNRVRAPFSFEVYRTISQPNGGGNVLTIVSTDTYLFDDGKEARVLVDYMHLDQYIKTMGSGPTGELLAIAGNTGFSTGPHTHAQYRRVKMLKNGRFRNLDKNDANHSFDPMPYYNGRHAVDANVFSSIVEAVKKVTAPNHRQTIYNTAYSLLEQKLGKDTSIPKGVNCANAVTDVLIRAGVPGLPAKGIPGTWTLNEWLKANLVVVKDPLPGDIIMSPTGYGKKSMPNGHVGIVGKYQVMSNNSRTGKWDTHFTQQTWRDRYETKGGYPVIFYRWP